MNGQTYLRLFIGINTPEGNEAFGSEATAINANPGQAGFPDALA